MSYNQGWNNQQQYAGQPTQQYYNQYNSYGTNANSQSSDENKSSNPSGDTNQINSNPNDLMLKSSNPSGNMSSTSSGNKPGFNSQYTGYNSNYSLGQSYNSTQSGYNQQNYNQSQPNYNQNYPDYNQAQQNYNSNQQTYPKNQSYQGNIDSSSQNFNQQSYNKVSRPSTSNYKQQQSYNYNQNQQQSYHLDGDNKSGSRFSQVNEPSGGNRAPINTKPDSGYDKQAASGMGFNQQRPDRPQDTRSRFDQGSNDRDMYEPNRDRHIGGGDRDGSRNMDRGRNRSNFNDRKREGGYPDRGGYNNRGWSGRDDNSGRTGDTHVYRNESTATPISSSSDVDTTPGPESDTIFVSGLGQDITELKIAEYFGQIGVIKKDKRSGKAKIYMYMDKESGEPKGECTVTYDDPPSARAAINWFDKKEFNGGILSVSFAQQRTSTGIFFFFTLNFST